MRVTAPPRSNEAQDDRDLARRVAELEALIEEARRRTRRRRRLYAAVVLAAIGAGAASSFGLGGNGQGTLDGGSTGSPAAQARPGRWEPSRGPEGGAVTVAVDPTSPRILYAGGWGSVFKSTNGGASWKDVTAEPWTRVDSVAIDPAHAQIVYAGTDGGVAKTTDGGRHWRMVNGGLLEYEPGHRHGEGIYGLVIDSHDSQTVFATSDGALIRTTDGGAHWRIIGPQPYRTERCTRCFAVAAIDPNDTRTIYATWSGRSPSRLYKSADGGTSWHRIELRGSFQPRWLVALDVVSGTLYATASSPGVYKSADGGSTWSSAGLQNESLSALKAVDGTLYATVGDGSLLETTDGGASWRPVGSGADLPQGGIATNPRDPSILYGIGDGVVKSIDGGHTWAAANKGLVSTLLSSLVLAPDNPNVLYAGSWGEVFKSSDGGSTWRGSKVSGNSRVALAADPQDPRILYAGGCCRGIFRSDDAGRSWQRVETGFPARWVAAIAIDPQVPSTVYVAVSLDFESPHGNLLKTVDGGTTWREVTGIPWAVQSLALDPRTPSTVFAGTSRGLYRSLDGGTTWARVATASVAPNVRAKSNLTYPYTFVAIAIDPLDPDNVYAGIRSHGILRSSDGGDTWTAADTGLTDGRITALAVDPHDPRILYAGAAGGGVFRSTDGARTWHPFGAGLQSAAPITAFAIGPNGGAVFAATEGDGVVRLRFG